MRYEDFKEEILQEVTQRYSDCQVEMIQVVKNDDNVLDGLMIKREDSSISPNIYVNTFYHDFESGRSMSDILEEVTAIYSQNNISDQFNISEVTDWEQAKTRIICKLCSVAENEQYLADKPFSLVEDLAVTYHVAINQGEQVLTSSPIHSGLMEKYGVDVETLHQKAIENMDILMPASFRSMESVMEEMLLLDIIEKCGVDVEQAKEMLHEEMAGGNVGMYVLTNEQGISGAACILNPKTQEMIAEEVGGDFYILPSSTHEMLIVPKDKDTNYIELENMVKEVNMTQVAPEERLSNHVYEYDSKNHQLMRSDMAQEKRKQQENSEKGKDEKKTLKEKLEEKKEVVAAQKEKLPKIKNRQAEATR